MGLGGGWGVPPTYVHIHVHACTSMHAHIHVKHDNVICKWQPPLGESLRIPYDVTSHPHPPTPTPQLGTPRISQNSIALELIEIFQFSLKI